ncbi:hypothetical protein EIP86_011129 [Pleurotus ostreatoroseus]|nr:hypothetical protein EIP86_011129 [Pleurotus ostreatoroseus]
MAPADRIHKHFAITAGECTQLHNLHGLSSCTDTLPIPPCRIEDPFPTTADLISSRKAPSTLVGRAWFTFKSFVGTFLTFLVDLLAWVYDKVILLSFPTLYDERCLGLLYSHRMIFDREGDDDINPSWFYQPRGPGQFFHADWRALMGSFAREWFLMAVASALVFTYVDHPARLTETRVDIVHPSSITVAFLRQYFDIIIADPFLHSLSLLALLSSINALWCDTVFFFFANEAQHYNLRDAYHWTTYLDSLN